MATPGLSLHKAAEKNDVARIEWLLSKSRVMVDKRDPFGYTAAYWAARGGSAASLQKLLQSGANPNAICEYDKTTPLHGAVEGGHLAAVELLLSHGADRHAANNAGLSPLRIAEKTNDIHLIALFHSKTFPSSSSSSNNNNL